MRIVDISPAVDGRTYRPWQFLGGDEGARLCDEGMSGGVCRAREGLNLVYNGVVVKQDADIFCPQWVYFSGVRGIWRATSEGLRYCQPGCGTVARSALRTWVI